MASCIHTRQLDPVFNGSGATQGEKSFVEISGTNFSESFAQLPTHFGNTAWRNITHLLHLLYYCFGDALVAMTDIHVHQSGREVEITFPVIIIEVNTET